MAFPLIRFCFLFFASNIFVLVCAPASNGEDLAEKLNLITNSGSLPLWSQAAESDAVDLSQVVNDLHPSIFIVGDSEQGYGTAFVISQKHRLLATNAHVADIMHAAGGEMLAIQNGTANVFHVDQVYYHPGVRRVTSGMVIRTTDPDKGDVDPRSPDVAVLRLTDEGELPSELPLATPDEIQNLLAKPVGMLGFPGHDTVAWPSLGKKAEATFRQAVVCRITDFANDVDAAPDRLQFIQHSMANWFGFSGSPIFLANGHVLALNNSGRTETKGNLSVSLAYGVRVDCLWELLKFHDLLQEVPISAEPATIDVDRFSQPDEQQLVLSQVEGMITRASVLTGKGDEAGAAKECNAALLITPKNPKIYSMRGKAYINYGIQLAAGSSERIRYYQLGLADAQKAVELDPTNVGYYLGVINARLNLLSETVPTRSGFPNSPEDVAFCETILQQPGISDQIRSSAYREMAYAKGMERAAYADLERSIELGPWSWYPYADLALYQDYHGDAAAARRTTLKYESLKSAIADCEESWRLATSPVANERNGGKARDLVRTHCETYNYKWWSPIRALAAAYAELGDFDHAVEYAEKAIAVAPESEQGAIRRQLKAYSKKEPWRESF